MLEKVREKVRVSWMFKWYNLKKFLQDISLYILVNDTIYNTDTKKITFALSFMNEGDAASWKEQLLKEAMAQPDLNLGTWK